MTLTPKQKKFIENNHGDYLSNGEFLGDDNDLSCLVYTFAKTVADAGYPETSAQLTLDLQPKGFVHGSFDELVANFVKNSPSYL